MGAFAHPSPNAFPAPCGPGFSAPRLGAQCSAHQRRPDNTGAVGRRGEGNRSRRRQARDRSSRKVRRSDYKCEPNSRSVGARSSWPGPEGRPQAPDLGKGRLPPAQTRTSRRLESKDGGGPRARSLLPRRADTMPPGPGLLREGASARLLPPTPVLDLHSSPAHTHLLRCERSPPRGQSGCEPQRGARGCRHRDPRPPKHPAPHPQLRPPGCSGAEARAARRRGVCPQTGRGGDRRGGGLGVACAEVRGPPPLGPQPCVGYPTTARSCEHYSPNSGDTVTKKAAGFSELEKPTSSWSGEPKFYNASFNK